MRTQLKRTAHYRMATKSHVWTSFRAICEGSHWRYVKDRIENPQFIILMMSCAFSMRSFILCDLCNNLQRDVRYCVFHFSLSSVLFYQKGMSRVWYASHQKQNGPRRVWYASHKKQNGTNKRSGLGQALFPKIRTLWVLVQG